MPYLIGRFVPRPYVGGGYLCAASQLVLSGQRVCVRPEVLPGGVQPGLQDCHPTRRRGLARRLNAATVLCSPLLAMMIQEVIKPVVLSGVTVLRACSHT